MYLIGEFFIIVVIMLDDIKIDIINIYMVVFFTIIISII